MSRAPKGGRRRLDASVPPEYDLPTREPRIESPRTARFIMALVFLGWVAGTAGSATSIIAVDAPGWIERPSAALLMVVFAIGLTHRGGGHMRIVAADDGGARRRRRGPRDQRPAGVRGRGHRRAGVGVGGPRHAARSTTVVGAIREYSLALLVALSGTLGVAAWNAPVNYQRFNLIVLTVSLGLAITLVWNLGAGLHGLGRQNLAILLGVAGLVMLVIAYSSFVRTHGSQSLVQAFSDSSSGPARRSTAYRDPSRCSSASRRSSSVSRCAPSGARAGGSWCSRSSARRC